MKKFITVSEFSSEHSVRRGVMLEAVRNSRIPDYCSFKKDGIVYLNGKAIFGLKNVSIRIRKEAQDNFVFLIKNLMVSTITRLCILIGADFSETYGREIIKKKLLKYRKTSVASHGIIYGVQEFQKASDFLIHVVKLLGSFDENTLGEYICNIKGIDFTPVVDRKKEYLFACIDCGKVRSFKHKPSVDPLRCTVCNTASVRVKSIEYFKKKKIRYYYFCPTCPSAREVASKRKTNTCRKCIIKKGSSYHKKPKVYFDLKSMGLKMECIWCEKEVLAKGANKICPECNRENILNALKPRYYRICLKCPSDNNTKEVSCLKNSGIKHCMEHREQPKGKDRKQMVTKKEVTPKKSKKYSQVGTDGAKRNKVTVKFQIVDENTMEAPTKKRKEKEIPISTPKQDADMIAKFLKSGGKITKF